MLQMKPLRRWYRLAHDAGINADIYGIRISLTVFKCRPKERNALLRIRLFLDYLRRGIRRRAGLGVLTGNLRDAEGVPIRSSWRMSSS